MEQGEPGLGILSSAAEIVLRRFKIPIKKGFHSKQPAGAAAGRVQAAEFLEVCFEVIEISAGQSKLSPRKEQFDVPGGVELLQPGRRPLQFQGLDFIHGDVEENMVRTVSEPGGFQQAQGTQQPGDLSRRTCKDLGEVEKKYARGAGALFPPDQFSKQVPGLFPLFGTGQGQGAFVEQQFFQFG